MKKCRACQREMTMYKINRKEFINKKEKEFEKARIGERQKDLVSMKKIGGEGKNLFRRVAWEFIPQYNIGHRKVFVIERLRHIKTEGKSSHHTHRKSKIEYRIGYFVIGKKGSRKGRWTWGQYCPMIPHKDIDNVCRALQKLKTKKGT